jgi:eukaryotic-like serine/threonine-protein kinase
VTVTTPLLVASLIATAAVLFAVAVLILARRGRGAAKHEPPAEPDSPYELLEVVGTGQMGTVHKARHRRLGRPVAIKTINPGNVDAEDAARFEREARTLAALHSPHTVSIHDFGTRADGSLYYVMELLSGIDLQAFVERHGAMAPERASYVLRQICHSLEEAHSIGLVHRDLKPSNVMLCKYGLDADFVKVVDFGLVKVGNLATEGAVPLTKEHTVLGTPAYLAPESLKGSRTVLPSADVYALGCIAFWLLTARLVFDYQQTSKMVAAHAGETPPPPSRHAPTGVPAELDALVLSCLAKQPESRPSAGELVQQLERLQLARAWTGEDARRWWQRVA